jgi:psiF repeat
MKALLILVAAVSLLVGTVTASPADDKKGDDRKAFMSQCLKGGTAAPMTQQDKMKKCNVDAGDKKGDERKAFMSQCLKSDKKS